MTKNKERTLKHPGQLFAALVLLAGIIVFFQWPGLGGIEKRTREALPFGTSLKQVSAPYIHQKQSLASVPGRT